jgi:2-methylcitrate dehydratase PrpD
MVAVMLLDGTASFAAAHDKARMGDAAVRRERAKVQYVPDAELARLLPVRVAVVEVTLTDGTTLSDRVEAVRGTVRNPMTREEIVDKSRDLMAPVLGAAQTRQLIDSVLALDTAPDLRPLGRLLQR